MNRDFVSISAPRTLVTRHEMLRSLHSDEILVGVEWAGVCGSDLHFFEAGASTPGTPFGHEIVGTVLEASPAHAKLVGTRVVVNPYVFCARCHHCASNRPINCAERKQSFDTGFATHAYVTVAPDAANVLPAPSGLSPAVAALAEPASVAIHAAARVFGPDRAHVESSTDGDRPEAPTLVLGAGPIGLLLTAYLTQSLGRRVWVLDRSAERVELGSAIGAERSFRSTDELTGALASLPNHDAPIAGSGPLPPVPVIFECTGAGPLLALAAHEWLGRGGVICQVAVFGGDSTLSIDSLLRKEADLLTSFAYSNEDWTHALEFLSAHELLVKSLTAEYRGLDSVEELLRSTAEGNIPGKPVLRILG